MLAGPLRAAIFSDIHYPYHSESEVKLAVKCCKELNPDIVLLNGDIFDFYAISRFASDPRQRDFPAERDGGIELLAWFRQEFPKARIIFKLGNHEERWEYYLRTRAPELLGIEDFELEKVYKFDAYRIEMVKYKRAIKIGDLNVLHGHEYGGGITVPVNFARTMFLKTGCYTLAGHCHYQSQHPFRNVEGKDVMVWTQGCLCQIHQEYRPHNQWSHGFSVVEVMKGGKFFIQVRKVSDGTIY